MKYLCKLTILANADVITFCKKMEDYESAKFMTNVTDLKILESRYDKL